MKSKLLKLGELADKLPTMTAQEVFDAVASHLHAQNGKRSVDSRGRCLYNGDKNCCGAAPFIKDYEECMEGYSWADLTNRPDQSNNHSDLISSLQVIHDDCKVATRAKQLTTLAKHHGLKHNVVNQLWGES